MIRPAPHLSRQPSFGERRPLLGQGEVIRIGIAHTGSHARRDRRLQSGADLSAGTKQIGDGPPNGSEIACVKTVNGQDVKEGPFMRLSRRRLEDDRRASITTANRAANGPSGTTTARRRRSITTRTACRTASIPAGTPTAKSPRSACTRTASAKASGSDGTRKVSRTGKRPTRTTRKSHDG